MQDLRVLFPKFINENSRLRLLPQSGSARRNYILENPDGKFVITQNENTAENEAFIYFSEIFAAKNLNTPKVLEISADRKSYVQEFLGDKTLSEIIAEEKESERVVNLIKKTLLSLRELQQETTDFDFTKTLEYPEYDEFPITNDLFYFKNFLVDVLEIPYQKYTLLKEFKTLSHRIAQLEPKCIMIRDFQSRNILADAKDDVYFIDYQSAMYGPAMYDVVSLLYQAKANFSNKFKREMTDFFLAETPETQRKKAEESVPYLVLIRLLQVLGAYGFRGIIQRKKHFLESLNQGILNISEFMKGWDGAINFPELSKICAQLTTPETATKIKTITDGHETENRNS